MNHDGLVEPLGTDEDGDHLPALVSVSGIAGRSSLRLEADDKAGGDGLGVDVGAELSDAAAVAIVDDAPVEVGDEGEVGAGDDAVGEVVRVSVAVAPGAVGGFAEEEFSVGHDGEDGNFYSEARAEDAAVDVAGEVAADIDGEVERGEVAEAVVEAEGAGGVPAGVLEAAFFGAAGAIDGELGLGVEGGGGEAEQENGEDSAVHA
jgi:hypothetical protein